MIQIYKQHARSTHDVPRSRTRSATNVNKNKLYVGTRDTGVSFVISIVLLLRYQLYCYVTLSYIPKVFLGIKMQTGVIGEHQIISKVLERHTNVFL